MVTWVQVPPAWLESFNLSTPKSPLLQNENVTPTWGHKMPVTMGTDMKDGRYGSCR